MQIGALKRVHNRGTRRTAVAPQDNPKLITVTWPVPVPPMCLPLALGTRVCVVRVDSAEVLYKTVGCYLIVVVRRSRFGAGGPAVLCCALLRFGPAHSAVLAVQLVEHTAPPSPVQVLPLLQQLVPNFQSDLMLFNTG